MVDGGAAHPDLRYSTIKAVLNKSSVGCREDDNQLIIFSSLPDRHFLPFVMVGGSFCQAVLYRIAVLRHSHVSPIRDRAWVITGHRTMAGQATTTHTSHANKTSRVFLLSLFSRCLPSSSSSSQFYPLFLCVVLILCNTSFLPFLLSS